MSVENLFKALNLLGKTLPIRSPPGIKVDSKMGVWNPYLDSCPSLLLYDLILESWIVLHRFSEYGPDGEVGHAVTFSLFAGLVQDGTPALQVTLKILLLTYHPPGNFLRPV